MEEYSREDLEDVHMHLFMLKSRGPPLPSEEPDIKQRRDYVERFLSQRFPRDNHQEASKVLRKYATIIAAKLLIKGETGTTTVSRFAWKVDKVFWDLWRKYHPTRDCFYHWLIKEFAVLGLLPKSKPAWPWPQPPTYKNGEQLSTAFASLREAYFRDGKLDFNHASVPEDVEHQAAQLQNESTSTGVMACDKMHNPLTIAPPTLESRRNAWEALYPGVAPSERGRPFTLILPAEFDFWTFVYGPDGRDFNKIRERLMEERIEITWSYEERVHSSESYLTNPEEPPETGHAIIVGPLRLQGENARTLSFEGSKTINLEGISRIWHDILAWHRDFTKTRTTTLRSYLEDITETRKARTVQGTTDLPEGFKDVLAEIKKERNAWKDVINGVLDRKSPESSTIVCISNWALRGKKGKWLGIHERMNLAGDLWRERAETPEEKLKISELILGIKERAKSGLLRDYELLKK